MFLLQDEEKDKVLTWIDPSSIRRVEFMGDPTCPCSCRIYQAESYLRPIIVYDTVQLMKIYAWCKKQNK